MNGCPKCGTPWDPEETPFCEGCGVGWADVRPPAHHAEGICRRCLHEANCGPDCACPCCIPQVNWTKAGASYTDEPAQRERLNGAIHRLRWEPVGGSKPMGPALAISAIIKECGIPRVDRISISSNELAPLGLYGVQGHYRNGTARAYVIDEGSTLVVIRSDFWEGAFLAAQAVETAGGGQG